MKTSGTKFVLVFRGVFRTQLNMLNRKSGTYTKIDCIRQKHVYDKLEADFKYDNKFSLKLHPKKQINTAFLIPKLRVFNFDILTNLTMLISNMAILFQTYIPKYPNKAFFALNLIFCFLQFFAFRQIIRCCFK